MGLRIASHRLNFVGGTGIEPVASSVSAKSGMSPASYGTTSIRDLAADTRAARRRASPGVAGNCPPDSPPGLGKWHALTEPQGSHRFAHRSAQRPPKGHAERRNKGDNAIHFDSTTVRARTVRGTAGAREGVAEQPAKPRQLVRSCDRSGCQASPTAVRLCWIDLRSGWSGGSARSQSASVRSSSEMASLFRCAA